MADSSSHLEKMGRELKCPICLSLLDSAVSLTCNHVFCDVCINKSMKSQSNCPVCKVPYQRREIRPAPHMDNLVNIYKSMKVASRTPRNAAQDELATILDAKRQTDGDLDHGKENTDVDAPQMVQHHQKTDASRRSKSKAKSSGRNQGKSSFSMNKRIQVPESPSTETPLRQAKEELKKTQTSKNTMNNSVVPSSELQHSNGKEDPGFAPFFWLRDDDDAEKPSQQTDEDKLTCTPLNAPSFSDIKDSDDDVSIEISPKAPIRKCVNIELFDSEMFEWTQRPCSPELCPSPSKMQGEDDSDGTGKYKLVGTSCDTLGKEVSAEQLDDVSLQEINTDWNKVEHGSNAGSHKHSQIVSKMAQKRGTKGIKRNQNKRRKIIGDLDGETRDCSNLANSRSKEGQISENNSALGSSKSGSTSNTRSIPSADILLSDKGDNLGAPKLPASLESERCSTECNTLEITKRNSKRIKKSHGSKLFETSKPKQKLAKTDDVDVIESQDKGCGDSTLQSNLYHEKSVGKASRGSKTSRHKNKRFSQVKTNTEVTNNKILEKTADGSKGIPAAAGSFVQKAILEAFDNDDLGIPHETEKANLLTDTTTLRKCSASSIKCAFCLKTEETEASGEILHYVQGKPVPATHGGDFVIHSHKNCAEWAPNVYFENDTAVNLEEELARSRRIKCSLCSVKGAALGCYEKSCRKSFHVPCAKKLRECRWDFDHFVILCPLHVSSKLPCELSTSQVKNGRSNLKGKLYDQRFSLKCGNSRWICGRPSEKIVLCGSALTTGEKEDVSKFTKLSGVALSEKWSPSVTHVIASTVNDGECKRTLKVLKGILEGKWILSVKWVRDCTKALKLVEETPYEISRDIYGIKNGPYLGRLRLLNKQPKLFSGFKFYLTGDFEPSFTKYVQDLTTTAGGTILHRKPIAADSASCSSVTPTLIIYAEQSDKCNPSRKDLTPDHRRSDAEAIASSSGARVANEVWMFDCIAGHKVIGL